jgi:hypothetical protein
MAFNLFWGTGYLIYSGVANTGDWASAITGLQPLWLCRLILVALGFASYAYSMRVVGVNLRPFTAGAGQGRARRLLFLPYVAAGLAACAAALFYKEDPVGASVGAFRESFLTDAGLLMIPLWLYRARGASPSPPIYVTRRPGWVLTTAIALSVFVSIMGRGLRFQL